LISEQDARTTAIFWHSKMKFKKSPAKLEIPGSTYFITFNTWEKLELTPPARKLVLNACLFFHQQRYQIYSLVIMLDHVHLLLKPFPKQPISNANKMPADYKLANSKSDRSSPEYWSIGSILHSIKSYSAKQIPSAMNHIGKVWQDGRYDRLIRDRRQFDNTWEYIRQNPVKAGLCNTSEEYQFYWEVS